MAVRKTTGVGWVYFLWDKVENLIKVGWTGGVIKKRLRNLQGQSPDKRTLEVIGAIEGGEDLENKLHRILDPYRKPGHKEWFYAVPFVLGVLDEIKAAADPEVWANAHMVYYPTPPPPNNGAWSAEVPVPVDGTPRQRPVPGTSKPSLAVLRENLK